MTFNAASRLRSLEDRSAALGSRRCELPGMHSVPKSAVLPYASGVGGLSRRLLNIDRNYRVPTNIMVLVVEGNCPTLTALEPPSTAGRFRAFRPRRLPILRTCHSLRA